MLRHHAGQGTLSGMSVTRFEREVTRVAADIIDRPPDRAEFLHSLLCQLGLPRSRQDDRVFERSSGKAALRLEAGTMFDGTAFRDLPLPYGARPRLVLHHICSEAVRRRSPLIPIGNSLSGFLRDLGYTTGGREHQRFRSQMTALCAVRMTLGHSDGFRATTIRTEPVKRFEAWVSTDDRQRALWPGELELSPEFYSTLLDHAVPLDPRALKALRSSALALDVYTWLGHRLCRVGRQPVKLSWANLRDQFGQEYADPKDFKKKFAPALRKALAVYPSAHVDQVAGGIELRSSPPPIPRSRVVVSLGATSAD